MKKILTLAFLTLLFCSCQTEKKQILDVTTYGQKTLSLEDIKKISRDTTHNKAFIFLHTACWGCLEQTKNNFVPAQKAANPAEWKFYYILRQLPKNEEDIRYAISDLIRRGVDTSDIYFYAYTDTTESDFELYNKILPFFKKKYDVTPINGVPQTFIVSKYGQLAITQEKYQDSDSTWYAPRDLNPTMIHNSFDNIPLCVSVVITDMDPQSDHYTGM